MNNEGISSRFYQQALELDANDPLKHKQELFQIPLGKIYLDGNSLGPLPFSAKIRAKQVVEEQWGEDLIESWNTHDWIDLPITVGNKVARLIGAEEGSVICCDSISVNLFKVLASALKLAEHKTTVLSQSDNFPTDLYMVEGLINLLNDSSAQQAYAFKRVSSADIERTIMEEADNIGVLLLTHVNYKTGDVFDMQRITKLAHAHDIIVIWDLAHSAGVLPLELQNWDLDFAVGCTYKYLNGGPGAPAFVYVAPKHLALLEQPLTGWMGHQQPFSFAPQYQKAQGIEQMLCGTPSIISMSILDAALDVFDDVNIKDIRKKSIGLNAFFQSYISEFLAHFGLNLTLGCNHSATDRGSQISILHKDAYAICQALISKKVIPDFRSPNVLRIGFSPLFLTYSDVYQAATILAEVLISKEYLRHEFQITNKVT